MATRLGAATMPLVEGQLFPGEARVISGSVLYGHRAMSEVGGFLGRYANQISCLAEDPGGGSSVGFWPGFDRFSTTRAYTSRLRPRRSIDFTTTTHGAHRAMVPIGLFEKVMPLDIMPTFLLRALLMDDLERAEALGCLELDEEDLALCAFVSPGKEDYGPGLAAKSPRRSGRRADAIPSRLSSIRSEPHFDRGGKLEFFYPLYESATPSSTPRARSIAAPFTCATAST